MLIKCWSSGRYNFCRTSGTCVSADHWNTYGNKLCSTLDRYVPTFVENQTFTRATTDKKRYE